MNRLSVALVAWGVMIFALALVLPAGAQTGGPGAIDALATQAAIEAQATAQAIQAGAAAGSAQSEAAQLEAQAAAARAKAAQQAAVATQQAANLQARQAQAQATSQAAILQATLSAQATRSAVEATATQAAMNAAATAQAQQAQATGQAIQAAQDAQATRQAIEAQATRQAYDLALAEAKQRSDFGTLLLYLAGVMALVGTAYVLRSWALVLAHKAPIPAHATALHTTTTSTPAGGMVIDVTPIMLPAPSARMTGNMRIVDDPELVRRAVDFFDRLPGGSNEDVYTD